MRNLSFYFKDKSIDFEKLCEYGFIQNENSYVYEKLIFDNQFNIIVEITQKEQISKVIDLVSNDEYVLADIKSSSGEFVGKIKEEYENVLNDIVDKCTTPDVFKSTQAKEIISYVKEKYNDDLEFLWVKFPDNAVLRNKSNNKWYAVLMILPEQKLGLESDKIVDIIDLRYQKDKISEIIDGSQFFGGYHMNKNNWITIRLNGSVDTDEIIKLLDNSYNLSLKK